MADEMQDPEPPEAGPSRPRRSTTRDVSYANLFLGPDLPEESESSSSEGLIESPTANSPLLNGNRTSKGKGKATELEHYSESSESEYDPEARNSEGEPEVQVDDEDESESDGDAEQEIDDSGEEYGSKKRGGKPRPQPKPFITVRETKSKKARTFDILPASSRLGKRKDFTPNSGAKRAIGKIFRRAALPADAAINTAVSPYSSPYGPAFEPERFNALNHPLDHPSQFVNYKGLAKGVLRILGNSEEFRRQLDKSWHHYASRPIWQLAEDLIYHPAKYTHPEKWGGWYEEAVPTPFDYIAER